MSIPSEVVREFPRQVRDRGQLYYVGGKVRIVNSENGFIDATVQGTELYNVMIECDDGYWRFECNCPASDTYEGVCKHCWATLLKADNEGLLPNGWGDAEDEAADAPLILQSIANLLTGLPPGVIKPASALIKAPAWKQTLTDVRRLAIEHPGNVISDAPAFPSDRRIVYLIDVQSTHHSGNGLTVEVMTQKQMKNGTWERPKASSLDMRTWLHAPDENDRMIAQLLLGSVTSDGAYYSNSQRWFAIPASRYESILKRMCDTGRCGLRFAPKQATFDAIQWDDAGPWEFCVELERSAGEKFVFAKGFFQRGEQRMEMSEPEVVLADGLLLTKTHVAPLNHFGAWPLVQVLRSGKEIKAPIEELPDFLSHLGAMPRLPKLRIPDSLEIEEVRPVPTRKLTIARPKKSWQSTDRLAGELTFDYAGQSFGDDEAVGAKLVADGKQMVHRNPTLEAKARNKLESVGLRREWSVGSKYEWMLAESQLHRVVMELMADGWQVEAEGSIYRRPGNAKFEIRSSGIDWFELDGGIEFNGEMVPLPKLLAAAQRGETMVKLDDGSIGMLPTDWLAKYAPLAGVGQAEGDVVKFGKSQVGLLDALLLSMPEARCDETFNRLRTELRAFEQIESADAPEGFGGTLRPYQRDGLGWMLFLQKFGFGGCLADDMGLGKTVQVLALLEMRRRANSGPSLVVVPRSLIFNWKAEAERFAPEMRVLDHSGIGRTREAGHFENYDMVLTTYGTLRRDAPYLKDVTFDYVILDEAQAIKNSSTEAAKATRLLRGKHRLVLSGTPIENRLGDLWSLFEFLNPGMLGAVSVFRTLVGNENAAEGRQLLARALRPFILRRTKGQVATELPEKLEQTIFCDLEDAQRKLYDELRDHYRQSLLTKIDSVGMGKSKILVLEALLRLRQAACHPGLIDKSRANESSAKLDALFEQLEEVLSEGHKVLVFSQFTSFLALLRKRLDAANTTYEYLDGKTRDRQQKVERFQTDESCKLFLISLKAGGVGLNLTAADYVFLLDPWWNPAVESQAIDRTHRIGQTRRVFAYRLIARDTVEEKVLKLQQSKRELADAIITADNSLISKLGRDDLELLLS